MAVDVAIKEDANGNPKEIAIRVRELRVSVDALRDSVKELLESIGPVLRRSTDERGADVGAPTLGGITPLGDALKGIRCNVDDLTDGVREALNRLEL